MNGVKVESSQAADRFGDTSAATATSRHRRSAATWLLLSLMATGALGTYRGQALVTALRDLQASGVPVVFSTSIVDPELTVAVEPTSKKPIKVLAELLQPHGLEARAGPGGRWLVVPAGARGRPAARLGAVHGEVREPDGEPLVAAVVEIAGCQPAATTSATGRFRLAGIPEGAHRLRIRPTGGAGWIEESVEVRGGETIEVVLTVASHPISAEQIVVVSRISMLREEPASGVALSRDQIEALPHFGDDPYRAFRALPGVSGNDYVAAFNVRGGLHDELQVRLDGLELYEPFHLRDLSGGIFSILDPNVIGAIELLPGSFPAPYGDRSTGVVDITTERPTRLRRQLGISFSNAWAGGSAPFADRRGHWLGSARRGYLDLILDLANNDETGEEQPDPLYWDLFGKLDRQLGETHRLGFNLLVAENDLAFHGIDEPGEFSDVITDFADRYLWLNHQTVLGRKSFVDHVASATTIDHDRFAFNHETDERYLMEDLRTVDLFGLRQDWSVMPSPRRYLRAGIEVRSFDVLFDYRDNLARDDAIGDPRFRPPLFVTAFRERFTSLQTGLYVSDRLRATPDLSLELGLRWDRQTLLDEDQFSPRFNALYDLGRGGRLRLGWGHFHQSQKPHELEVQFGESEFQPTRRAEHLSIGWEIELAALGQVRLEAYRRREEDPRHRWHTLLDPFKPLPQPKLDLLLIDPDRVEARGLEAYLRGRPGGQLDWFVHYVNSSIVEQVDGRRQRRWIDQPHALTASVTLRPGPRWTLTGLFRYHTGWPTTAVSGEFFFPEEGEETLVHELGPFYGERLSDYHSLDLRISRSSLLRRGRLTLFLDIQNLYDRENPRGVKIEDRRVRQIDGRFPVTFREMYWLGLLPSFGASWHF